MPRPMLLLQRHTLHSVPHLTLRFGYAVHLDLEPTWERAYMPSDLWRVTLTIAAGTYPQNYTTYIATPDASISHERLRSIDKDIMEMLAKARAWRRRQGLSGTDVTWPGFPVLVESICATHGNRANPAVVGVYTGDDAYPIKLDRILHTRDVREWVENALINPEED